MKCETITLDEAFRQIDACAATPNHSFQIVVTSPSRHQLKGRTMDTLKDTLWEIGLSGIGRGAVLAPDRANGAAIGNPEAIGTPNRSTFNAMHHLNNGGVILSTRDHDTGDRITEKRSYS